MSNSSFSSRSAIRKRRFSREGRFAYLLSLPRRVRQRVRTRQSQFEQLELRQMMAAAVWTNVLQPLDVSGSPNSAISPLDALLVINELNNPTYAPRSQPLPTEVDDSLQTAFVDVTCDGRVSPIDALLVINSLNAGGNATTGNPLSGSPTWHFKNSVATDNLGGKVVANACSPRLVEGSSYATELSAKVTLPDASSALRVHFSAPVFDLASQNAIRDAFEIFVLDDAGQPLTFPFDSRRDASFNWSESVEPIAGVGTQTDIQPRGTISTATFNLAGTAAGTTVQVVLHLINNDLDSTTSVTVRSLEVIPSTQPAPTGMPPENEDLSAFIAVDRNLLSDVSTSVAPIYGSTSLLQDDKVLVTDIQIVNQSSNPISGRMIVAIDNLSNPTIGVLNPDGFLPGGRPYFVLSSSSSNNWLAAGERTEKRELRFRNVTSEQFTYSLTTLAETNQAPTGFDSVPLREIEAGKAYSTVAQALDPDGQALTYRLEASPSTMSIDANTGRISWQTTNEDVGNHSVIVRASDPYGLSVTQTFSISVTTSLPNRPPVFTSAPPIDAKVAGSFEVNTYKVGNQPLGVSGGIFDGENFEVVTVNRSDANLTVGSVSVSVGEPQPSGLLFQSEHLINVGFPTFTHPSDVNALEGFVQGDFNQDGNLDFVASGVYRQYDFRSVPTQRRLLTITMGDGQGGFDAPIDIPLSLPSADADHFYYLHAADFNRDGKLDLLGEYLNDDSVSGGQAPRLIYMSGRGDGTFNSAISTDLAGIKLELFDTVDINGDDILDIVANVGGALRAGVRLGNGDGTFGAYTEFANFVGTNTGNYYAPAVGDLDGINGPDVVLPDWQLQKLYVYLNDGSGGYTRKGTLDAVQPYWPFGGVGTARPQTTWIADFDGDGTGDILYATDQTGNGAFGGLGFYKGSGDGITFSYKDGGRGFQYRPYNIQHETVDFNGDGELDVLLGGSTSTSNITMGVGLGRGDGTFDIEVYALPFAQQEFSSNGSYATSIVLTGDYNRDGLLDAATVSSPPGAGMTASASTVSIVYADSPGKLEASKALPVLPVGNGTYITITGDVNNDGNLDLLIGAGDRFYTRLGLGDGEFSPQFPATPSYYANDAHYATLVDLDHDGLVDLLWSRTQAYQGANQGYMAALGNGDGTFRVTFNQSVPDNFYGAVLIPPADFNGDGYVDFAAYFGSAFSIGTVIDVYLYDPANPGTFKPSYRYIYPGDANSYNGSAINSTLTRGDFDGDGIVDLLAVAKKTGPYQNRINFFKGKGDGTFAEPTSVDIFLTNTDPSLVEPSWSDSGDINNDGKRDFVLVSAYGHQAVFLGNGDGTFQSPIQYGEGFTFGADRAPVLVDLDGDGNLDFSLSAERGRRGISIRRGLGDGTFQSPEFYFLTGDFSPGAASYSDIDNDGVMDLVISDNSRPNLTDIYRGNRPGLAALTTSDINRDGQLDVLAVNESDGHIKLMLGQGDGSFERQHDLLAGRGALALAVVDLNADQMPDVITANRASRSVSILSGDGTGKFLRQDIQIGELLSDLAQGDLTGDGRPDIVVVAAARQSLYLLTNSTSGLGIPLAIPTGEEPGKIAIADATGDGKGDIIVSLPRSNRVMILPGIGDGSFSVPQYILLKSAAGDVDVADFNLDGKPDLAVTFPETDQVAILLARGAGRFAVPQAIKVGDHPVNLVIQDVNGDGRPDLLVANSGDDTASEIINRFDPTNLYRYQPVAIDPDGDAIRYELIESPGGMLFNETTGEILWAPTSDQVGMNPVTIKASDGNGGAATQSFSIDVQPNRANVAPVFFNSPPETVPQDSVYSYTPSAVDANGDLLRYRLLDGPEDASIDPVTGKVIWDARNGGVTINRFSNSSSFIATPHSQSLAAPSMTVEGSFRLDAIDRNQVLFMKTIYDPYVAIHTFRLWYVNGGLRATIAGLDSQNVLGESSLDFNWHPQVGQWFHVAIAFDDASGKLSMFVDGKEVNSLLTGRHLVYDGQPITLGFELNNPYIGSVSNFRIWDSALTSSELQSVMNRNFPADAPGLVLDYRFLDGDALTIRDHSNHRNDGRRVGNGWPLPINVPGLAWEQTQAFTIAVEDGRGGQAIQHFNVTIVPAITQSIAGVLFQDTNNDGSRNNDEPGLSDAIIYVDNNLNGVRDINELSATTTSSGDYAIAGLYQGTYRLAVEPIAGFALPESRSVSLGAFHSSLIDLAAAPMSPGQIRGTVTLDANNNQVGGEQLELYNSRFDEATPTLDAWSNQTLSTSPSGTRFLGEFTNTSVTLSLGSLTEPIPAHDRLTIAFDLYILKSWDGNQSPDRWEMQIDGQNVVDTTFNNVNGRQAYPQNYPGGDNAPRTGATTVNSLGYTFFGDAIYHFEFTVPHSADTVTFTFKGSNLQDANDESWGLNNVRVTAIERPIARWPVYIDENNNKVRDDGEAIANTDSVGNYVFAGLAAGTYRLRLENPPGWTTVGANEGMQVIDLAANETKSSINFGLVPTNEAASQPRFITAPLTRIAARDTYRFVNVAVDPSARPLTYSLLASPEGMRIDAESGTIVWTPTLDQVGEQSVILKATNDQGGVVLQDFVVAVDAPNSAPIITSTPLDAAAVDELFLYDFMAQDAEQATLDTTLELAPTGAALNADGRISWIPKPNQLGPQLFRIQVSDGHGAVALQSFAVNVTASKPNSSPRLSDQIRTVSTVGLPYLSTVSAIDADNDVLSFQLITGPLGMSISRNGQVSWVPSPGQLGTQTIRVRASDSRGGIDERDYVIQVGSALVNNAPQFTSKPPVFAVAGKLLRYDALTTDADHDALAFELVSGPAGLSLDPVRGTMLWIPSVDQFGSSAVQLRTTDAYGGVDEQSFTIIVRSVGGPPAIISVPLTQAAVGHAYLMSTLASDAEGDPLRFALLEKPSGMTIHADTGEIAWTPNAELLGQNQVVIQVTDGVGGFATQAFSIQVSTGVANQPPILIDAAPLYASVGTQLTHKLSAVDPEGSAINYQLRRGPSSIAVDPQSGLVTWTPTTQDLGVQIITLAAFDTAGAAAVLSFEIEVLAANIAPVIQSQPTNRAIARGIYRYDVLASDGNLDPLRFTLTDAPQGMAIDAFGRIRWQTTIDDLGTHNVQLSVSDPRGGVANQTILINVVPDTTAPRVTVIPLSTIVRSNSPEVFAKFNLTPTYPTNRVRVSAVDDVGVISLEARANGKPIALDANGYATFDFADWGFGGITVTAQASDAAGNIGNGNKSFAFLPYGDDPVVSEFPAPSVVITSPINDSSARGVVKIMGSATSDHMTSYKLSVRPSSGISTGMVIAGDFDIPDEFTNVTFTTLATGTSKIDNGLLGTWDTTLLENGEYVLRLEEEDDVFGTTVFETNVSVNGEFKLGNFRLSFSDITIPVAGIPVTLTRTYDSLEASKDGDMGYGWRLEFRDTNLKTSLPKTGLESYGIYSAFTEGTKVYVTLPGGTREGFTFTPDIRALPGFGNRLVIATPRFTPDSGVKDTLTVRGGTFIVNENGELVSGGGQPYNPAAEEFGGGYTLTTRDGTQYRIDGNSGLLSQVIDRNNNTLTFTDSGITGPGNTSLTFERDRKGRITKATDPAGHSVSYAYDPKGDLVSVTDREGNVTSFGYKSTPAHYLDKIVDPLGRTGLRTNYDANGRLIGSVNATGSASTIAYDPGNQLVTTTDALGHPTTNVYDERGNVVSTTDALGRTSSYSYDSENRVISISDADGNTTTFRYDASGNEASRTYPNGATSRWTYDRFGGLLTSSNALGETIQITRDDKGNMLSYADALGNTTRYEYNSQGQRTREIDPAGGVTTYAHDAAGRVTSLIRADGSIFTIGLDALGQPLQTSSPTDLGTGSVSISTQSKFNANGQQVSLTDPAGNTVAQTFTKTGQLESSTDGLGRKLIYHYDEAGNRTGMTLPGGAEVAMEPNAIGQTTQATLPGGQAFDYEYDATGAPKAFRAEDGSELVVSYDSLGRPSSQSDAAGLKTERTFDVMNRVTAVTDSAGNVARYDYDLADRLVNSIDALGNRTSYTYDASGRVLTVTLPNGGVWNATYDSRGNRTSVTNPMGFTTRYEFDSLNRLTAAITEDGERTVYRYNSWGLLLSRTDALGHVTTFEYDVRGFKTAEVNPLGGRTTYQYDAAGHLIRLTNASGETVHYEYNDLGKISRKALSTGETFVYTYLTNGLIDTLTDSRGTARYQYDENGFLTRITFADGKFIANSYDSAGKPLTQSTSAGTTNYVYDSAGRLSKVTDADGGETSYLYDAKNRVKQISRPDGTTEFRTYDALDMLDRLLTTNRAGTALSDYRMEYDLAGQQTKFIEVGVATTTYAYNSRGELVSESRIPVGNSNPTIITYSYDAVGNRVQSTSASGATTSFFNEADQLIRESDVTGTTQYQYDAAGRLVSKRQGASTQSTYQWNAENRLVQVIETKPSGTITTKTEYDSAGFRVAVTRDGVKTSFVNNIDSRYASVVEEYATSSTTTASYTLGYGLVSRKSGSSVVYYHTDADGSVRYVTDRSGLVQGRIDYTAFGLPTPSGNEQPYQFAGEPFDSTSGLTYLRARHYDPATGRFISPDPFNGSSLEPISQQKYVYAANAPTNGSDPTGMFTLSETLTKTAIVGSLFAIAGAGVGVYLGSHYDFARLKGPNVFFNALGGFIGGGLYTTLPTESGSKASVFALAIGKSLGLNAHSLLQGQYKTLKPKFQDLDQKATLALLLGVLPKEGNAIVSSEDLASSKAISFGPIDSGNIYRSLIGGYMALNVDLSVGPLAGIATAIVTKLTGALGTTAGFNAGGGQVSIEGVSFGWALPNTQLELNAGLGISLNVGLSVAFPWPKGGSDDRKI